MNSDDRLKNIFNELQAFQPQMVAHAQPLGIGSNGIITDNGNGTVSKFFLYHQYDGYPQEKTRENDRVNFQLETSNLMQMSHARFDKIVIPQMVEEPVVFDNPRSPFVGAVKMTRVPGQGADWCELLRKGSAQEKENHFREVGCVLAELHSQTDRFPADKITRLGEGADMPLPVIYLNNDTNEQLLLVNKYLQDNRQPALIHGDFWGGNLMVDQSNNPTALIDFSSICLTKNHLDDFVYIIELFPEGVPGTLRGYEEYSSKPIDPVMLAATEIGTICHRINFSALDPAMFLKTEELQSRLAGKLREVMPQLRP